MTTPTANNTNNDKRVVIVGGGPSGAAAAKAMADRGYTNVHVYEAYPHPKSLATTSSKAYVIALSPRGQQGILDATGIDVAKEAASDYIAVDASVSGRSISAASCNSCEGVVSTDMARHVYNAKTKKTSSKVRNHAELISTIVPRKALTERLLEAATESGVHVHYQHRLNEVDFENRIARMAVGDKHKETKTIEVEYDLIIGADGCHSKVRNLMVENQTILKDFTARIEEDSMEYQVVVLPENPFANTHPEGTVHSWNNKELNSICLGFPMRNKDTNNYSMLFAVVFPGGKLESFRTTGYKEPLTKLLPDMFTDDTDGEKNLNEFTRQLRENHIANGGLCVWSSSLGHAYEDAKGNASGVVLLGDSAHGMWPSLGQGANCALESVAVFVRCLDALARKGTKSSSSSWTSELIQTYHNARFEDANAAVDLTYGGIGSRKSRGRLNAPLSYKLQMVGMVVLHKLTFGIVPMPALLRIMMGKQISYSTAKKLNFYYEKYICVGALVLFAGMCIVGKTGFPNFSGTTITSTSSIEL